MRHPMFFNEAKLKNENNSQFALVCVVCGRHADDDPRVNKLVYVDLGALEIITADEPGQNDGLYPIGKTCYRKFQKMLDPFIYKTEG